MQSEAQPRADLPISRKTPLRGGNGNRDPSSNMAARTTLQKQDVCTVERLRRNQYGLVQNNGSLGPTIRAIVPSFRFTSCPHPVNEQTISIVLCQPCLSLSSCSPPHRDPTKHSQCARTLGTMIRARGYMHPCGKYA